MTLKKISCVVTFRNLINSEKKTEENLFDAQLSFGGWGWRRVIDPKKGKEAHSLTVITAVV